MLRMLQFVGCWLMLASPARADEDKAVALVEKLGGEVERDEKRPGKPVITVRLPGSDVTDEDLQKLAPLQHLRTLDLQFTHVTEEGLKELVVFKNLTTLNLR